MEMLRTYKKKSDILVALGKASDDTRYLDRAMERGEVVKLNIN
jgi:predicted GTPase